jgi:hypothetical protein
MEFTEEQKHHMAGRLFDRGTIADVLLSKASPT